MSATYGHVRFSPFCCLMLVIAVCDASGDAAQASRRLDRMLLLTSCRLHRYWGTLGRVVTLPSATYTMLSIVVAVAYFIVLFEISIVWDQRKGTCLTTLQQVIGGDERWCFISPRQTM